MKTPLSHMRPGLNPTWSKPISLVVTKHRLYAGMTDSHEDIIETYKLKEQNIKGDILLVRVEIYPPDSNYRLPLDDWIFTTDQDLLPDWFDYVFIEQRVRMAIKISKLQKNYKDYWNKSDRMHKTYKTKSFVLDKHYQTVHCKLQNDFQTQRKLAIKKII